MQEARGDFNRALELDKMLSGAVTKELKHLDGLEKARDEEDKEKFKNLFAKWERGFFACL